MSCVVTKSVLSERGDTRVSAPERLSPGVAGRLSHYLQVLTQAKKMGRDAISSQEIGDYTNINATQIRRDLSGFGRFGKRGVGYNVDALIAEVRKILRTQGQHNIALIGVGRLGQAVAESDVFADHGFRITGIYDIDPEKIGRVFGGVEVCAVADLERHVKEQNIIVGVLAVPGGAAQEVADQVIGYGVRIIFNYSGALLTVPQDVTVHTTTPAVELLHALYYYLA